MMSTFILAAALSTLDNYFIILTHIGTTLIKTVPVLIIVVFVCMSQKKSIIHQWIALPSKEEFTRLTYDISNHAEFLKLKEFHHHTHHIYDHVMRVSYLSYFVSKLSALDYVSSARGALLHDFFLYDWREKKANDDKRATHGEQHPFIALSNAKRYFSLNKKEEDIIVKHMFPKTRLAPSYAESAIVSVMDKVSTVWEYILLAMRTTKSLLKA